MKNGRREPAGKTACMPNGPLTMSSPSHRKYVRTITTPSGEHKVHNEAAYVA
jgi:hypothetical protein